MKSKIQKWKKEDEEDPNNRVYQGDESFLGPISFY